MASGADGSTSVLRPHRLDGTVVLRPAPVLNGTVVRRNRNRNGMGSMAGLGKAPARIHAADLPKAAIRLSGHMVMVMTIVVPLVPRMVEAGREVFFLPQISKRRRKDLQFEPLRVYT
ncbi:hypothetical protein WM40_19230 [Robbsia andropogonis]|uniref:Uncharacterized protein n=1 Tax=Robbsia andropogonis TaxID=28092 RepID=A0A0F5JWC9_9BURK|nr:hypothetical protein WM40_19230 [Robbsia andropogonis]